jgi:hypothetical protein
VRSLFHSLNDLPELFSTDRLFSSNKINNQWEQLQMKRAKDVFPHTDKHDEGLLEDYHNYVVDMLTPKRLDADRLPLKDRTTIDLDIEYHKAEKIGREHLKQMFDDYRARQNPNLTLLKEMINLGMKQMTKRPKSDDLQKASSSSSNILLKAVLINKSKSAYAMSLKNIADDFMVSEQWRLFQGLLSHFVLVLTFWTFTGQRERFNHSAIYFIDTYVSQYRFDSASFDSIRSVQTTGHIVFSIRFRSNFGKDPFAIGLH